MFIGHYGVGFGAKRAAPGVSLGMLFFACQLADLLWPTLVLLGVEHVRIDPGNTAVTPLAFEWYPYSHSLEGLVLWGDVGPRALGVVGRPAPGREHLTRQPPRVGPIAERCARRRVRTLSALTFYPAVTPPLLDYRRLTVPIDCCRTSRLGQPAALDLPSGDHSHTFAGEDTWI